MKIPGIVKFYLFIEPSLDLSIWTAIRITLWLVLVLSITNLIVLLMR